MLRRVLGLTALALLLPLAGLTSQEPGSDARPVVEGTAVDYAFQAPDSIPSGWITFQMPNRGGEVHVLVVSRIPEDVSWTDWVEGWKQAYATGEDPSWADDVVTMGGPGLVMPGDTARTTLRLEPGRYAIVCGVKTPQGVPHYMKGMWRPLTVTEQPSGGREPEADLTLTLRSHEFATKGRLRPGRQTIRVQFEEQPENAAPHDVHLARMEEGTTTDELAAWFQEVRAPAPVPFLGGAEQMPAGATAYFTVDLTPGRYAWVCHEHADQGMVKTFTVE